MTFLSIIKKENLLRNMKKEPSSDEIKIFEEF